MRATSNLSSLLRQTAARLAEEVALVRGPVAWTWAELDARVDALAAALADTGIGPGDAVLLHAPNSRDYLTVLVAAWRVGAVITPTNAKLNPGELVPLAQVVRPALLVVGAGSLGHAAALPDVPHWTIGDEPGSGPAPDVAGLIDKHAGSRVPDAVVAVGDPAWFFFTSGSSGRPKAAVLTHDQLAFIVTNHLADLMPGLDERDATLVLAPLSHGAGIHVLTHIARGARIVLLPGESLDTAQAWSLIAAHRISTMFTVPTILNRLVAAVGDGMDRSSLRFVIYAGAPITRRDQRRAYEVLGPVVEQYYGLAEVTGAITVLPPRHHADVPVRDGIGTAGFARTGITISIRDGEGAHLPAGERGEICVAGPAVFAGYLDNPAANAAAFRDGWFRTGDLGVLDERGLLYITGRASDMYISGGSNIDPREIEEKILAHPQVRAVGVVGAPDPDWGEVGIAVAVVDGGLTADELLAWCRGHMARYKAPKRVHLVDRLPTTAYGKVTTPVLRALLQDAGAWPREETAVPALVHPGPVAPERVITVATRLTAHEVELPRGAALLDALAALLDSARGRCAVGELAGGELAEFSYFIPDVGPPGGPVATFSAPRTGPASARLVRGGITVGHRDGAVFCHSHAQFTGADGVPRAGHLIPDTVVLGAGVRARVWTSSGVAIEVTPDPETAMPLFTPRRVADPGGGELAAVICRVRPNVDITTAIETLTREQGWAGADVRGQVGSLVGGRLERPDGTIVDVDGPATEVMTLHGGVRTVDGHLVADLVAQLVDIHGEIHGGRVVRGANPVAMTYELALTEAAP